MKNSATVMVEISYGELFDKISILEIKLANVTDDTRRANVMRELTMLTAVRDSVLKTGPDLADINRQLREVNQRLWKIEDDLRALEQEKTFDRHFIELARSVYKTNDARAALKRQINELLGSALIEEKIYGPK